MALSPEGGQGQSRGELLQTVWKTALTAGAAQTLLASSALAEVSEAKNSADDLVFGRESSDVTGDV